MSTTVQDMVIITAPKSWFAFISIPLTGYGHATRVSAFSCHLLDLDIEDEGRPTVYIVSSAPQHVFSEAMERGALYRYADWIDPVIVQPLA